MRRGRSFLQKSRLDDRSRNVLLCATDLHTSPLLPLHPSPPPSTFHHTPPVVSPNGRRLYACRSQFTLQPSLPGAAIPGSNAGACDIKVRETGLALEIAYNEQEEDAEGNGMTADAASLGVSGCGVVRHAVRMTKTSRQARYQA